MRRTARIMARTTAHTIVVRIRVFLYILCTHIAIGLCPTELVPLKLYVHVHPHKCSVDVRRHVKSMILAVREAVWWRTAIRMPQRVVAVKTINRYCPRPVGDRSWRRCDSDRRLSGPVSILLKTGPAVGVINIYLGRESMDDFESAYRFWTSVVCIIAPSPPAPRGRTRRTKYKDPSAYVRDR